MNKVSLEGRRILVVEDDYMIAKDVAAQLKDAGAAVAGPVPSVAKALALIERGGVEAAVLDVNLGHEYSFPVAQVLLAKGIPFLFSTGYSSADVPPEWKHVTIVMKPLRLAAVAELFKSR